VINIYEEVILNKLTKFQSGIGVASFPHGIEKVCIELWNQFSRTWKSIEFGQNVRKVLKSMEINSTICLFKFCSSSLMTVLQMLFALCSMS